jgi:hypothetical protein
MLAPKDLFPGSIAFCGFGQVPSRFGVESLVSTLSTPGEMKPLFDRKLFLAFYLHAFHLQVTVLAAAPSFSAHAGSIHFRS